MLNTKYVKGVADLAPLLGATLLHSLTWSWTGLLPCRPLRTRTLSLDGRHCDFGVRHIARHLVQCPVRINLMSG